MGTTFLKLAEGVSGKTEKKGKKKAAAQKKTTPDRPTVSFGPYVKLYTDTGTIGIRGLPFATVRPVSRNHVFWKEFLTTEGLPEALAEAIAKAQELGLE